MPGMHNHAKAGAAHEMIVAESPLVRKTSRDGFFLKRRYQRPVALGRDGTPKDLPDPQDITKGTDILHEIKSPKKIGINVDQALSAAECWERYDKEEFKSADGQMPPCPPGARSALTRSTNAKKKKMSVETETTGTDPEEARR